MKRLATCTAIVIAVSTVQAAELALVQGRAGSCIIVAGSEDRAAAEQLAEYLGKMSGATITVDPEWRAGTRVFVGGLSAEETDALNLGLDGFVIRREGNALRLAGGTPEGTRNAVYRFLDMQGCRWYIPGEVGQVIPHKPTITVGDLDVVQRPAFLHRNIWPSLARSGMSAEQREQFETWKRRNLYGGAPVHVGHNFYRIAPAKKHFDEHPDWYALRNGKRDASGQLCTTNPAVIEHTVQMAGQFFDDNPTQTMYSLSPDDHNRYCHCEECDALDPEEYRGKDTGKGRRLTIFASEVAERLQQTHPGKNVAFYAYWGAVEAPGDIEAHPNVIVFFTPIGMAFNYALQDERSPVNVKHNAWYEGWRKVAHQMGIRHYYNFSSVLWIPWRELAAELRYQHEKRALYVNAELWADAEGSALTYYILGRLLWDLETDIDAAFEDFVTGLYGPAADPMRRYYLRLSDAWSNCGRELLWPRSFGRQKLFLDMLTPEVLEACGADLHEAWRIAQGDETLQARLRINRNWLAYMRAWARFARLQDGLAPGSLADKIIAADSLVRACRQAARFGPGAAPEMDRIALPQARNLARLKLVAQDVVPAFPDHPSDSPQTAPTLFRGTSRHVILAAQGDSFAIDLTHKQVGAYTDVPQYTLLGPGMATVQEGKVLAKAAKTVKVDKATEGVYVLYVAAWTSTRGMRPPTLRPRSA